MNVDELWALTQWMQTEVVAKELHAHYTNLSNVVQQNTQPNQQRVPIEKQKTRLLTALRAMNLASLTQDQSEFLQKLGVLENLGEAGAKNVERILFEGGVDLATASSRLQQITARLHEAIQKVEQTKTGLSGLVSLAPSPIGENEVMLRVTFTGEADISNVVNLKNWTDQWHKIARGIAMAHDQAPEDIRVVGASKGSIVLELATTIVLAKTLGIIILESLKVTERVLVLLQEVEKLKAMRLSNKTIAQELKKEADKEREDGTEQVTSKVVAHTGLKKTEGDKITALTASVKALVDFLSKGGEVDGVEPDAAVTESEEQQKDRADLSQMFTEIRQLEAEQRRIGHAPDEAKEE